MSKIKSARKGGNLNISITNNITVKNIKVVNIFLITFIFVSSLLTEKLFKLYR